MRTMMRRRFVLPVLLALVAALVGGLFAGLGGPDPVRDTQAQDDQDTIYFRFLPPVKASGQDVRFNCGWHRVCLNPVNDDAAHGVDFKATSGRDHDTGVRVGRADTVYLRGYGHAPDSSETYQPVTVRLFQYARGGAYGDTYEAADCFAVEAAFFLNYTDWRPPSQDSSHVLGRYRTNHTEPTKHGIVYKPYFGPDGAWNGSLFPMGDVKWHGLEGRNCTTGDHIHVARDDGNSRWTNNTWRYQTEAEHNNPGNAYCLNNKDRRNWTHQLLLSGSAPSTIEEEETEKFTRRCSGGGGGGGGGGVVTEATATERGSSTVSQAAAQDAAKANARAALPTGTTGITYTVRDLPQVVTPAGTSQPVSATGTGGGSSRQAAIDAAKANARGKLPTGTTGITYGTPTVTGGKRVEYSHTFSVSGTSSTRAGARSAALVNWRNTADNLSNLVRLGTRGVTTVRQTSTESWQATATGKVTRWRLVNDTRVEYNNTVTVEATASTKAGARQAALIRWRNYAESLSNFVRLGSRGISSVRQISSVKWEAKVSGTVILYRITPYGATITASGTVASISSTTYHAEATATGTAPPVNRAPTARASANRATVASGGTVTLTGAASDPDGDTITYKWTSDGGGTFANANVLSTKWTAPAATTKDRLATLTLTVTDSKGKTSLATDTIRVRASSPAPTPTPSPTPPPNQAPEASAAGTPTTVEGGGVVTLDGTASDPDTDDTLTHAWSSSGGGSFADASALDTTWTAPAATIKDQAVTLTLTVTDDGGLSDTAAVRVTVEADDPCLEELGTVSAAITRTGSWSSECPAQHRRHKYGRYFSFVLAQEVAVTIDLRSTDNPRDDAYLLLLEGEGRFGDVVTTNDDIPGGQSEDSRITRTLAAGTYTAEATTYAPAREGGFTLTVTPAGAAATAPVSPATPTVEAASTTSLAVSWPEALSGGAPVTAYDVRHIEDGGTDWTVVDSAWTTGELEYTVTGLAAGTTYNVQVRAVNSVGDGGWSPSGSGTTTAAKPVNKAPVVSVNAFPTSVDGGGVVVLLGSATDPEGGSLTYAWASDGGGSFAGASDTSTVWTAPAATPAAQTINLTLTVTDTGGATATATVTVTVAADS